MLGTVLASIGPHGELVVPEVTQAIVQHYAAGAAEPVSQGNVHERTLAVACAEGTDDGSGGLDEEIGDGPFLPLTRFLFPDARSEIAVASEGVFQAEIGSVDVGIVVFISRGGPGHIRCQRIFGLHEDG